MKTVGWICHIRKLTVVSVIDLSRYLIPFNRSTIIKSVAQSFVTFDKFGGDAFNKHSANRSLPYILK